MYQPNIEPANKYGPTILDLTQNSILRQYSNPDFQNNSSYYTWNNTLANTHTCTTNSNDYMRQRSQMDYPVWSHSSSEQIQYSSEFQQNYEVSTPGVFNSCLRINTIRLPAVNTCASHLQAYQRSQQLPLNPPVYNNNIQNTYGDPSIIQNNSNAELSNWGLVSQSPSDTSGIGTNSNDSESSNAKPSDSPTSRRTPTRKPSPLISPIKDNPTSGHQNDPDNSPCMHFCKFCDGGDQQKYENQRHRQRMMFKKKIFREKFAYYKRKLKLLGKQ